jgi:hypothetical protein
MIVLERTTGVVTEFVSSGTTLNLKRFIAFIPPVEGEKVPVGSKGRSKVICKDRI